MAFYPLIHTVIEKQKYYWLKVEETEQQIYRFEKGDTDLALRFDLTVTSYQVCVQHFLELTFPFRRYHIGKVYREKSLKKEGLGNSINVI